MSLLNLLPTAKEWKMTETLLKVAKKHDPPDPPAYSTCVVNCINNIESGITHEPSECPD
jgi:hypothetical protein